MMTKQQIKEEFLAGEMDYITAVERLTDDCHLDPKGAEAMVESWG